MLGSVLENREIRQTRASQMKTLNIFYHLIYWTQKVLQNIMDDMVCWSMTQIQMCSFFIHSYMAIFLHNGCNDLWCHYSCAWPGQGESVIELMPIMNFLVHSYTCSSDRHASPTELSFVDEFDGFHPYRKLFFFGACCKPGHHLYTTTALSRCIPASYCHPSATLQTMSIIVVNLQDNRAVFRIFIALLKFAFDSPSYKSNFMIW